ncbi:MAG TPA: Smr/MutS family protein [Chthonomonadales bacterium]|nr:Smr/MutS family protein [Chthonomonadales bacterium]
MRADRDLDFHGHTREQMRQELDRLWGSGAWSGLQRVRVIHGRGTALWRELHRWCREKGLEFEREPHGGSTLVMVARPDAHGSKGPLNRPLAGLAVLLPDLQPDAPAPRARRQPPPPTPEPPAAGSPPTVDDRTAFEHAVREIERQDPRVVRKRKGAR